MKDYISVFEYYKDIKEIADFIDDVGKLRFYFSTQQFDEMQNHINSLMQKYCIETIVWNAVNNNPPPYLSTVLCKCGEFLDGTRIQNSIFKRD